MKLLSVVVPCYNSESYLRHCVDLLLRGGEALEIILVNDGSTDATGQIAAAYAAAHPTMVKAITEPNGGHGTAIVTGLQAATGQFFKVVDSDDWLAPQALKTLLARLGEPAFTADLDMLICNFIYDKVGARHKKTMQFRHLLPEGRAFSWADVRLPTGKYLLMHAVIYRTSLLQAHHLRLPAHTFYEDNLYVFYPLPFVRRLRYLDLDLYHYFIGRADQSVNENVMIGRIDQQLKVNRLMIAYYRHTKLPDAHVARYMRHYLSVITGISSIMLLLAGTDEAFAKKQALWAEMQQTAPELYRQLRRGAIGQLVNLPGRWGRAATKVVYRAVQRVYQFN